MHFIVSENSDVKRSSPKNSRGDLSKEQRILEQMVLQMFEQGDFNLGENTRVLKQSGKLDQLIVDEMMLRELKEKYPER